MSWPTSRSLAVSASAVREVQEFLLMTSARWAARLHRCGINIDQPVLMRRQAGYLTLAIAESFRDEGQDVLVLMD